MENPAEEEPGDNEPLVQPAAPQDPEEPEEPEEEVKETWLQRWCSFLYTYTTPKEVNIKDRRLGYIFLFFFISIALYLVIVVFSIQKGYLESEKAQGKVYAQVLGSSVTTDNFTYVWDSPEEGPAGRETNTAFIPSKVIVTRRQYQGICASTLLDCERNSDCDVSDLPNYIETPECGFTPDGVRGCMTWQWCPPESRNFSDVYYLRGAGQQQIWIRTDIKFRYLSHKHHQTFEDTDPEVYPTQDANTFTLKDLLYLGLANYSAIVERGAVLYVKMFSNCKKDPDEKCDTHVEVDRMDDLRGFGYSTTHAQYYREAGVLYRDLYHMFGVRIIISAFGVFTKPSLQQIVLQISAAIGQLIAAKKATDAVMTLLLKEKRHYNDLKIIQSKDFND